MISPSIVPPIPDVKARRAELFRETSRDIAERIPLGLVWAAMPKRIDRLPGFARVWLRDTSGGNKALSDPRMAGPGGIA